jgi:manganese/zinc/iron transport system substrate-binding protein
LRLEARLADMLAQMARRRAVVAVTAGLEASGDKRLRRPPEFEGQYDPHVWHDAALWADCVAYAAEQLAAFAPQHAADYRRNADAYIQKIMALHETSRRRLAEIPKPQRMLVTAHDAFGYFGQAYDVEVHGLQGISTADAPNVGAMETLVDLLVDRRIKAVFVETSVPRRNVESLIEAARARGHEVRIGGQLYSDAMGRAGTKEGTYLGMFEHNVDTIVKALK